MAELVMAFGASHAPITALPPQYWGIRRTADMMDIKSIDFRCGKYSFEELEELRKAEYDYLYEKSRLPAQTEHFNRVQVAIEELSRRIEEAKIDCWVIVADDHYEIFKKDIQPTMGIFTAPEMINSGFDLEGYQGGLPEGVEFIRAGQHPPKDQAYPIQQDLALGIVEQGRQDGIDFTVVQEQPVDDGKMREIPHGFGWPYRRLIADKPLPMVPILMNTYFPPNQPTIKRSFELGQTIAKAIESWDSDARVAVMGSGGLTHFVVDEDWDQLMIKAMAERDLDTIYAQPEALFEQGTSEVKNWFAALGSIWHTDWKMDLIDYVPGYRTHAGTGVGLGFASWSK